MVTVTEREIEGGNKLSFIHRGDEVQFVVCYRLCVCVCLCRSVCVRVCVSKGPSECFFRYVNMCVITSIRTYEFISFDRTVTERGEYKEKEQKTHFCTKYKPVTIFQSKMYVPFIVRMYDSKIMPR